MLLSFPTGNLAILVTTFGKPFTSNGFGNWFRKQCDEAGLKHSSAHGLRKAGAALAAENGATERQLMAIFGWTTMKEASRGNPPVCSGTWSWNLRSHFQFHCGVMPPMPMFDRSLL